MREYTKEELLTLERDEWRAEAEAWKAAAVHASESCVGRDNYDNGHDKRFDTLFGIALVIANANYQKQCDPR